MTNDEQQLLQQCIASGQVSPEQIEAHRAAGEVLNTPEPFRDQKRDSIRRSLGLPSVGEVTGTFEVEIFSRKNMLTAFGLRHLADEIDSSFVKQRFAAHVANTTLPEGMTMGETESGAAWFSLTRQSVELGRAERLALDEALRPGRVTFLQDFMNAALGTPWGEPKTCLSCGRKQEPDGTLSCGH